MPQGTLTKGEGNVEPYLFQGVVLPERAQLSLSFELGFTHVTSGVSGNAKISVVLNQIAVWVDSEYEWDVFDLRNVVKNIIQGQLAMIGFVKGIAYDFEITRVLSQARSIDYVFGIDIPLLAERNEILDLNAELTNLRTKTIGPIGMYLNRCFNDLILGMKHADDTGFYCYRAVESLRHHCAAVHGLSSSSKTVQWEKFRNIAQCNEQTLRQIKDAADPLRHGDSTEIDADNRAELLRKTWDVVDGYIQHI